METVIIIVVTLPLPIRPRFVLAVAALLAPALLASCSSGGDTTPATPATPAGGATQDAPCPTDPVAVTVSVDQWGGIVSALGGACAEVTTVLESSSADPHDYEPSPADAAAFTHAQLVVLNGGHYDEWAAKLAASSAPEAPVIDAIALTEGAHAEPEGDHGDGDGHADGINPHVWYNPATVTAVADAVTSRLSDIAPGASDYFAARGDAFAESMRPYDDAIAAIKAGAAGKTYAATESVFDDMAGALGLQNRTPAGYQASASNETDPSPADLNAFLTLLGDRGVDVLIYNTQTEGSVPEQLRGAAEAAGIPVVEVTETVAPGADSFEAWQVDQLTSLAKALGVSL